MEIYLNDDIFIYGITIKFNDINSKFIETQVNFEILVLVCYS